MQSGCERARHPLFKKKISHEFSKRWRFQPETANCIKFRDTMAFQAFCCDTNTKKGVCYLHLVVSKYILEQKEQQRRFSDSVALVQKRQRQLFGANCLSPKPLRDSRIIMKFVVIRQKGGEIKKSWCDVPFHNGQSHQLFVLVTFADSVSFHLTFFPRLIISPK